MAEQLIKKTEEGHSNVMPKSWIEAITDKSTGESLTHILQGFNMYFLSYTGNTEQTRCQVPKILRKKGLWVTYVKYDGNVYTEWYNSNDIDDKSWGNSSNWRIGNNELVGDLTISANGNWVINGNETEFKAIGEKGNTPLIRIADNKLQVSYDTGNTYHNVSDNPVYTQIRTYNNKLQISTDLGANWTDASDEIAAYFRFNSGQGNNVGSIQISRNNKDWNDLSGNFVNNLHISKYIGADETLPTSGIAEGTIYAKGPTYADSDTSHSNPIYRLWVYAYKGNTLAWQDNGKFTSIAAGIVQETGSNENVVMSQKAITKVIQALETTINKKVSFAGIATPTTNPGTPDGPVFYIANGKGTYTNFGGIDVTEDEVIILYYDNIWHKDATGIASNDKLTELEGKTKDLYLLEEDSFIITDKNGNKIASFDKGGLHVTSIEVLKDDSLINILNVIADKVDKVDGKQLSTEDFTTELKEKLDNLIVNEDILDVYDGLCIVDSNGYKALEIDAHGDIRMNRNINGALSGKSLYTLCDSLGTAGHWQKKLCDITGMVFDNNINVDKAHPLSAGGTKTSVSGMGTFTRAKNLVEYWKGSQGKTIDVLIIENINDMNDAGGHGDINDSAWFLTQQIVLDAVQSNSGAAESYFNNNVSSIVSGITKKFGTTIRVPYSSGTAYRLQVTSKASQNGNITITIGSDVFIVGVNTEDSLADIAFKIAEYDFTNAGYSVYQDSETSVILTRTSSTQSVVVNTNSTGVVISNSTTTGVAYLDFCYIGSTLDSVEWSKLSNWMEQVTWNPISVVSLWARYKGLFDYLCKNLPDTKIFFMIAPRMSDVIANTYKKTDGTYDVKAWMDANNSSTLAVREIQKQVAKMYNIPVLDMWEEANFTLANAEYNYAGGSGVHPGINGYNRIGEAVARLINY